ncbi:SDR family NAD(P)-dependent oxidoreductase [Salinicola salarius]|uniref:SDR family NAD(P)-dependent oxidoreductase n=1 Tax=Salinicola salarius TaxID=430457 RepID=UPI000B3F83D7|nr:SDR family NAD(P)-dependent oxidoreductase [Salinicola salarius]
MQEQSQRPANGAVVVTGGGSGIGRAIAERFAAADQPVLIFDRDGDAALSAVSTLTEAGGYAAASVGSVACEKDVTAAFAAAAKQFGGVRVLINNAGVSCNRPTFELSLDEWQHSLDVNLTGVFLCAREAARHMRGSEGVILNMSSMYGVVAAPNRLGYCATKSAVAMMSKALAVEWATADIRVNAIAPGYIRTALLEELINDGRVDAEALTRRTPQGRFGSVQEVADLAYFLASDQARFITGQVIGLDGGWSANGYL